MSIPAMAEMAFPNASAFVPYVQPKSGHAINVIIMPLGPTML